MVPREVVLEQIHHRETCPIPYSLGFDDGTDLLLDEYYGSTAWRECLVPYMIGVGGVDTLKMEAIDETRSRDGFGGIWRMDRRPWHLEQPPLSTPSFDDYALPSADEFIVPDLRETARARMDAHPDSFSILSLGWGLFEQSWRIRGFENALMDAVVEPDFYAELLDRLTELYLAHVAQCADIPADAIQFGDDWGHQRGVILGPERWRRFLKPRWARIYEAVHAQGKIVISHCCGSIVDIMPDIIEIGLDVLESVQPEATGMNPYALKAKWGQEITFYGGLGSQSTIPFGTPEEIHAEVRRLCREMGRGGGYILHPAKSIQPGTPPENMAAVVEAFTEQDR
jgi:uroporphyrinogen decarboxylase